MAGASRVEYAGSRFRVILLGIMLVVGLLATGWSFGQDGVAAPGTAPGVTAPEGEANAIPRMGLIQLIIGHADVITGIILILSIIGLTLIIQGFIKFRSSAFLPKASTDAIRSMIENRQYKELLDFTETDPSFVSRVLNPALKRAPRFAEMKEALETAVGEQTADEFRRIEYLNIIGNLGPLLGLLGTVLGMIYAFQEVAAAGGQTDVTKLSDGIAVALAHTFMGLFLAVPCLAAFGILRTLVDRLTVRGALAAEELLMMTRPPEARATTTIPNPAGSGMAPAAASPAVPPSTLPPAGPPRPAIPPSTMPSSVRSVTPAP